jgi:photosystem II stability/assembly factor-like uncharacterized protein
MIGLGDAQRPRLSLLLAVWAAVAVHPMDASAQEGVAGGLVEGGPGFAALREPRVPRYWRDLSVDLPEQRYGAVTVDPRDREVIFAGTDGFVFKSDDGGESWRPVLSFPRGLTLEAEVVLGAASDAQDPADVEEFESPGERLVLPGEQFSLDNVYDLEGDQDGNLKAYTEVHERDTAGDQMPVGDADLGDRFFRELPGVRAMRFLGPNARTFFVATGRGLYRSIDGGETYTRLELPGGALENDVRDVAVDGTDPSRLYVATAAGLRISDDGGQSFKAGPGRAGAEAALAVAAHATERGALVLVGTVRGLLRSWDSAETFRELLLKGVSAFEGVGVVAFDSRSGITYAGTRGGLFAAEREMALLEPRQLTTNVPVLALSVDPRRPRGVAVGLDGQGLVESTDTGITAVELPDRLPVATVSDIARTPKESDAILLATERGIFRHEKGTGIEVASSEMRKLQRLWRKEPTLSELSHQALDAARLDVGVLRSAKIRARLSSLLPELRATYRYVNGRPDVDTYIVVVDDPDTFDETDGDELIDLARSGFLLDTPSVGQTHTLWVTLRWNLDRVVYDPGERDLTRLTPNVHSAQSRILNRIQTAFGARRRLQMQMTTNEATDPRVAVARMLRLSELTAILDAATAGGFLDTAAKRGAGPEDLDPIRAFDASSTSKSTPSKTQSTSKRSPRMRDLDR